MKPALVVTAILFSGCAHAPDPGIQRVADERTACLERCQAEHDACVKNPPGLCVFPCGRRLFMCPFSCPPGPPRPPVSTYPRAFEEPQP